jgi:signal transduction histidine kinase
VRAALGEGIARLPWLAPGAAALVALAKGASHATWREVRPDPGAVLLIVRQTTATLTSPALSFFPALLYEPAICTEALRQLDQPGFVDWSQPATQPIYHASLAYASLSCRLAECCGRCDPENAWVAGLLAPLGWLAVCATNPTQAADCLAEPTFARRPAQTQQRLWGFDQAALARRLARRWRLPSWLAAIVGHLGLPVSVAQTLGADPDLLSVVQLAVLLVQQQGVPLHLTVGTTAGEGDSALGLTSGVLEELEREARRLATQAPEVRSWQPPQALPLLRELLTLAAENRRLGNVPLLERLETEVDDLHQAVEDQHASALEQLQTRKLNALAEFAAGAGHEINNPLAVISGQAQYLLRGESDGSRQQSLQIIVSQTQRIHETLRELMQFARPPRSQKQELDLVSLVREALTSLGDLASERRVRLVFPENHEPVHLDADPTQLRTALTCLLRNAIEAAGADGWAGIRLERVGPDQMDVVVEDSGSGPAWAQREHLFDPFYSGRPAGRGRGLGLPTAWRLAREQGGDVRFVGLPGGPTRFVLSLPHANGTAKNGTPAAGK